MLTDRISNRQGEEPSVRKRGHAGWMLASCVAISVVLCYGQISNSKAVIGLCLLAFWELSSWRAEKCRAGGLAVLPALEPSAAAG